MSNTFIAPNTLPLSLGSLPSHVAEIVFRLLEERGLTTSEAIDKFLSPDYERDYYDPLLLPDMERAVERLLHAIHSQERTALYGDFDCDGIPGTVLLHDALTTLGAGMLDVYFPHRNEEGFGFHAHAVDELASRGVSLIITIDCGISSHEACIRAKEYGIDVIITDHHIPGETVPDAYAVVNPSLPGSRYPHTALCGAGVVHKIVRALLDRSNASFPHAFDKWLLDMAGIATIADMVSLREQENRALTFFGLTVLRKSRRPGLRALLKHARVSQKDITEDDVGFAIAPRINAASRMDVPEDAFRLLTASTADEAERLALHLERLNQKRKTTVARIVKHAKEKLNHMREIPPVIVAGSPDWPPSLMGLVASALADTYNRPAFVWGRDARGVYRGSCRSEGKTNVLALMRSVESLFIECGGHEFSGGFSLTLDGVVAMETSLIHAAATSPVPSVMITESTTVLSGASCTIETYEALRVLAPFGVDNPKPLFSIDAPIKTITSFGVDALHRRIWFSGFPIPLVAFYAADDERLSSLKPGDMLGHPLVLDMSSFGERRVLQLRLP